ncbi:MAG TPA: hypothetical protein VG889_10180 [Rhizomicrobium sp.]|nr:hypothetical protein [Rhizomicrobium sp.]
MTDDDLDRLLSAPLDTVADNGFSSQVVARAEKGEWWRERIALFAPVAAAAAIAPFLPLRELTEAALRISPLLANSSAIAAAAAALALTLTLERRFNESAL